MLSPKRLFEKQPFTVDRLKQRMLFLAKKLCTMLYVKKWILCTLYNLYPL